MAFGLDRTFALANAPADPRAGYRPCRSAYIPPNTLHHLVSEGGWMAFLYVDANSVDADRIATMATSRTASAAFDLGRESEVIGALDGCRHGRIGWKACREVLQAVLLAITALPLDERVPRAMQFIHEHLDRKHSAAELARHVQLSPSRFMHLFKSATGVPLRRYVLWARIAAVVGAAIAGESLTQAALGAGFSSSAHFSAVFRETFGLSPSQLLRQVASSRAAD